MEEKVDYNSTKNQGIKDRFVNIHVHAQVNALVEFSLSKSWNDHEAPIKWDEIDNIYVFPEWSEEFPGLGENISFDGGSHQEYANFEEIFDELRVKNDELLEAETINDEEWDSNDDEIREAQSDFENLETEMQEPLEWWVVSSFLADKLEKLDHPVVDNIWGRCTSGQAILLDWAISEICSDMEILEGQSNEWKT